MFNRERVSTYLCMTKDVGVGGFLFGGRMMSWMDEAAGIFAMQYTGMPRMVTLRFDEMIFRHPVRVGDVVEFFVNNPKLGRTSLSFELEGRVGDCIVIETECTFISVDEKGYSLEINRPTPGELSESD